MSLGILQKYYFLDALLNSEYASGLFKKTLEGHQFFTAQSLVWIRDSTR